VTKRPRLADVYLQFLQLTETVHGQPALPALAPLESRILELIVYARLKKERLSVKDLMGKRELGSPAMLHGRLKSMREKGWIMLEDTEDARRKQLVLTKAALTHFDKLSRLMVQTIKKSGLV
jgi:DNA-binding MarR family transcriptional regulator